MGVFCFLGGEGLHNLKDDSEKSLGNLVRATNSNFTSWFMVDISTLWWTNIAIENGHL